MLVAITLPFVGGRINQASAEEKIASQAVTRLNQMTAAVAAVGGHAGVFPCKSSFAAVNHSVQTALAWKLHVTLGRVGTSMRHQGVMFVGPHDSIDGIAPPIDHRLTQRQLIATVGAWKMYRMTAPNSDYALRRALTEDADAADAWRTRWSETVRGLDPLLVLREAPQRGRVDRRRADAGGRDLQRVRRPVRRDHRRAAAAASQRGSGGVAARRGEASGLRRRMVIS